MQRRLAKLSSKYSILRSLIPGFFYLLSVQAVEAKSCGEAHAGLLKRSEQIDSSSFNDKLFEKVERAFEEKEGALSIEGFSGEGYCAYRVPSLDKELNQEIVKPAFLLKKEDKVALLVANSFDSYGDKSEECIKRVALMRENAENLLRNQKVTFGKRGNIFLSSSHEPQWRLDQQLKYNSSGILVKAAADNPTWQGQLNCHFIVNK